MHAAYRQSAVLALADGVGGVIDSGWSSSTRVAFDFRANGSAWPMYALFLVCLVVFSVGAYRLLHGPPSATRPPESARESNRTGRLGRLFRVAVLQRRILRRGYSGLTHLPIFWGFVILAAGSLVIMVDSYLLPTSRPRSRAGAGLQDLPGQPRRFRSGLRVRSLSCDLPARPAPGGTQAGRRPHAHRAVHPARGSASPDSCWKACAWCWRMPTSRGPLPVAQSPR